MDNFLLSALLPMKGHSERVPNKNLRSFNGRPLFHWILETLIECPMVGEVLINTDSAQIAESARSIYPEVRIIERPEDIQGDFVSMNRIIEYDLSFCTYDHILQTHSTNPLVSLPSLNLGVQVYFDQLDTYDSLFSVTSLQSRFYWADGSAINHNPKELKRTQDLEPVLEENSCFYIFNKSSFSDANARIGLRPKLHPIPADEAMDIDEEFDFQLAEMIHKHKKR